MNATRLVACLAAPAIASIAFAPNAEAHVTISSAATQNMVCSAGTCAPTGVDAILNVGDLETLLASGTVTVSTTGSGVQANSIVIAGALAWTSANALTLDAYRSIAIKSAVSVDGTANLTLIASHGGTGASIRFGKRGRVAFSNLSSVLTINQSAYTLVDSIKTLASAVSLDPTGNFALANDYDASHDGIYAASPIAATFSGNFDGLGNEIANLAIDDSGSGNIGLFAELGGGEIRNLGLTDADIRVTSTTLYGCGLNNVNIGALVGYDSGLISHSYATGKIAAFQFCAGGLVGWVSTAGKIDHSHSSVSLAFADGGDAATGGGLVGWNNGTITDSYASGSLSNSGEGGDLGGLVGYNGGAIHHSFATGSIMAQFGTGCGGFVGLNYQGNGQAGVITNSYATGSQTCAGTYGSAGGFADENEGTIERCYSIGSADGQDLSGGFVSYEAGNGSMYRNYWDTTTSGNVIGVGEGSSFGLEGLTSEQLQSGLPRGFLPSVWVERSEINSGFPYLRLNRPPK